MLTVNTRSSSLADTIRGIPLVRRITKYFDTTTPAPEYKRNDPWNHLINDDAKGLFRVYYQNPHGVPRDMVSLGQDLNALAEHDVGCYCFAETNLDWSRPHVKNEFLTQQRKVWKYATTAFSSIEIPSSSDYLTGGTLTSAVGSWSTRVSKKEEDPSGMGRWSSLTLIGKQNKKLTIITGYRCVRSSGDGSAWTQEKIFMRDRQSKEAPHPRKQFIADLTEFIQEKQKQKHDIILNLDANEVLGEESGGISKLARDCRLYDLLDLPDVAADEQLRDTYRRGSNRRIDYMFGSQRAKDSIRRCGALAYNDGIISDHRGLFLDLDPTVLFGGNVHDPVSPTARGFTSKNEKKVKKYLEKLEKYLTDHKVDQRVDSLIEDAPRLSTKEIKFRFEAIDRDMTRGMLYAEKHVKPKEFKYQWSVALDQAGYRH